MHSLLEVVKRPTIDRPCELKNLTAPCSQSKAAAKTEVGNAKTVTDHVWYQGLDSRPR